MNFILNNYHENKRIPNYFPLSNLQDTEDRILNFLVIYHQNFHIIKYLLKLY